MAAVTRRSFASRRRCQSTRKTNASASPPASQPNQGARYPNPRANASAQAPTNETNREVDIRRDNRAPSSASPSNANFPDEPSLRAAAVERLGYDPFRASGESAIYATILRKAHGLRGEIRLYSPDRESALHSIESVSTDCAELGKAMALAISIAVD